MPPKGGNSKKEAGRAKKAENEDKKKQAVAAVKSKVEEDQWAQGTKEKDKAKEKEDKKRADAARKAENARLLAEEEASIPKAPKAAPKAGASKKSTAAQVPAGPGAIAAGGGLAAVAPVSAPAPAAVPVEDEVVEAFAATGLDDALELLETITAKTDKAAVGTAASGIERHPERRFKAALEAYQERELPNIRKDHPGLRLQQYKELLFKQFQKSPDNPFNQTTVDYNATKEDKLGALKQRREAVVERLREKEPILHVIDRDLSLDLVFSLLPLLSPLFSTPQEDGYDDGLCREVGGGSTLRPILTPTDLYVLDVDVQLNPILESKANDFNLLFNISTGQTGGYNPDDRSRDLPFAQKDQPATLPRLTEIIILTKYSPWVTVVRSEKGVTMADVCTQLWKSYTENPITDAEFAALPPRHQDLVRRHAASNAQGGYFSSPAAQGRLRRCDWLRDRVWLDAMYIDERYTKERLGFYARNIFLMNMNQ